MRRTRTVVIHLVSILIAGILLPCAAWAQQIDLDEFLYEKLQPQEKMISKNLFDRDDYRIESVAFIGRLSAGPMDLRTGPLSATPIVAGQRKVNNCSDAPLTETFTFAKTEEKSLSISNSQSIKTGVEATISAEMPLASEVSATFSFEMDTSTTKTTTDTVTEEWADTVDYTTQPNRISTVQFVIDEVQAQRVPYTLPIHLAGDAEIRFLGRVCFSRDNVGQGWEYCIDQPGGREVAAISKLWGGTDNQVSSVRIEGPYSVTLYDSENLRGERVEVTQTGTVPSGFNDRTSSFRISANPTVQVEDYLATSDLDVTLKGTVTAKRGISSEIRVSGTPCTAMTQSASGIPNVTPKVISFSPEELVGVTPMSDGIVLKKKSKP